MPDGGVKLRVSDSGFVLPESYRDCARVDPELSPGAAWISEVILHPQITCLERSSATAAAQARIHVLAHEQCFIANPIKMKVMIRAE